MRSYLLDSGFLYALVDDSDQYHESVRTAADAIFDPMLLPTPAITETAYFVQRNLGQNALVRFVESLDQGSFYIIDPVGQDFSRAGSVLRTYPDQDIDFVDALIFAMAERMSITRILTIDRRHFSMFRPKHCGSFEILP